MNDLTWSYNIYIPGRETLTTSDYTLFSQGIRSNLKSPHDEEHQNPRHPQNVLLIMKRRDRMSLGNDKMMFEMLRTNSCIMRTP